jgi:hypothetical protein
MAFDVALHHRRQHIAPDLQWPRVGAAHMKHRRRACRRSFRDRSRVGRHSARRRRGARLRLRFRIPAAPQVSTATRALLILRTSALANRHGGDDDSSCKVALEKRMGLRVLGQGGAARTRLGLQNRAAALSSSPYDGGITEGDR